MLKYLQNKIKKIPIHIWILLVIIVVGIFLRTYHFHDWLRFSMDQSRDAFIISDVLDGKTAIPLLGPLAGGTSFHLGPAYYYFSLLSAKIFGNYPDKMAYPSLIFSILAIPLLFLFLREYFSKHISLSITGVMSFSYFFIEASRFSSNPNLAPFFVLLFLLSIFKITNFKNRNYLWWSILVGLSLGIGVQLHTTLMVIMPIFTLVISAYIFKRSKMQYLQYFIIIILIAVTVNVTQIISEINTRGENTRNFILGTIDKGGNENNLVKNAALVIICQAKSNANIILYAPVLDKCYDGVSIDVKNGSKELYGEIKNRTLRKVVYISTFVSIFIFYVLGYAILVINFLKEKDRNRKTFLLVAGLFNAIGLLVFIPVISSISVSYFNILFFIPFIFLGFLLQFFQQKFRKNGKILALILAVIMAIVLLQTDIKKYYFYKKGLDNNINNSNLGWVENVVDFLGENNLGSKIIYMSGEGKYLDRYFGSIDYMLYRQGLEVAEVDITKVKEKIPSGQKFVYIKNKTDGFSKSIRDYQVVAGEHFDSVDVYILKNSNLK
jgi:4-amino-4-deoxy-L-arabinose transferase-like glycosyltransferase